MSERETLAEALAAEFERVHRQAGFGYMPAPKETERVALSWLAGVLADDATVEVVARRLDDMNADGWIVVPNRNTGEPMQEQVPPSYVAQGVLAALSAHLAPARDGDTSGEAKGCGWCGFGVGHTTDEHVERWGNPDARLTSGEDGL